MVTATNIKEEMQRIAPGSILLVNFPSYKMVGHLRRYPDGIDLVPGEKGAPLGGRHLYEKIAGYRELTARVVQPSDIREGDMIRITEDECRIVGFVRRIDEDSLSLATGNRGFPTRHLRSGIEEYALLE